MKLTPAVRAVLQALAAQHGAKLSVRHLAAQTRLQPPVVRVALAAAGRGRLVQHVLQRDVPDQPPRTVFWLTGAGLAVATGHPTV